MKPVLTRIALSSFVFVLLFAHLAFAETKTFIKEYTYQASEDDSRNSSRVIALREVKRLLLEELGTYLESETDVKNFRLTRDQITTLTAGIVQTEIIEEKWDGRFYWLKSKIAADEDNVVQSINELRKDREKTKELEAMRQKSDDLLKENKRLRKELASAKDGDRDARKVAYDKSIKELSAAEWIEKGQAVQGRDDDFKGAIDAFSHAIELDPKNIKAYYFRARISGKYPAMSDYSKLLSIEPNTSEDYLIRAWTYKELEKRDLALQEFAKAIETASGIKEKAAAYDDRGRYTALFDNNRALQDFSRAIELDPDDKSYYISRGQTYWALKKNDPALRDFNKAIELDPKDALGYATRGAFFKFYKPELAIIDLSRALELGQSVFDYLNRAQTYERLGRDDLAIQDYSKIIELYPDHIHTYNTRASLYAKIGRHDLAIKDYNKTIKLKPDRQSAYMDRAKYYAKYGKHELAIKDFDMAIKLNPEFGAYVERGFSYFNLGKDDFAIRDFNMAIALNYEWPAGAYYNRALVYARQRNPLKAIQDLTKAIELDPFYKKEVQKESQFDSLRKRPDFIKLVGE